MPDTREKFITSILGMLISQRNVWDVPTWSKEAQSIYDFGVQRAMASLLSITDSRHLNASQFRLTSADGEVIEFWPDTADVGLVVEIEERYKKLLGK